jgi:aspartyl-tRNA(Asn)/glutamyl-tRNA(Gln) amidotransferase subunit C
MLTEIKMIDKKEITHIAKLARLEIKVDDLEAYAQQLSKALNYFEQISKVDTKGVEPLVTPSEMSPYLRADEVKKELTAEEIVANAPYKTGNLFTVPPVV